MTLPQTEQVCAERENVPFSAFMKKQITNTLGALAKTTSLQTQANIAAAILLVGIVKADGRVERAEMMEVIRSLTHHFGLSGEEVGVLLETASDVQAREHDLSALAQLINEAWTAEQKSLLLTRSWAIAISDQLIDIDETKLIEHLANLLNLSESEISAARQTAENKLKNSVN